MPPVVPPNDEALLARIAGAMNQIGAIGTQQQLDVTSAIGQLVLRTGILPQWPTGSPTNYTSGYGLEVLSNGAGSAPVIRAGQIVWQSSGGGARTIYGLVKMDSAGLARVVLSTAGIVVYDTSGNVIGNVPYFSGSSFVGDINF